MSTPITPFQIENGVVQFRITDPVPQLLASDAAIDTRIAQLVAYAKAMVQAEQAPMTAPAPPTQRTTFTIFTTLTTFTPLTPPLP